jgi:hypothetical protein
VPPDGDLEKFGAEISARPPVLLIHGEDDDLIPAQALFQATQGSLPSTWRCNGTCRPASGTASTRKDCATAANFSRTPSLAAERLRDGHICHHCMFSQNPVPLFRDISLAQTQSLRTRTLWPSRGGLAGRPRHRKGAVTHNPQSRLHNPVTPPYKLGPDAALRQVSRDRK